MDLIKPSQVLNHSHHTHDKNPVKPMEWGMDLGSFVVWKVFITARRTPFQQKQEPMNVDPNNEEFKEKELTNEEENVDRDMENESYNEQN
ncbi:hypothetical protein M5689_000966 [Euphorbia peplus]|nr:hypothetical protein M5689_000966 [Euphorbia peplus]